MASTVWKFDLVAALNVLEVPVGAEVLHVDDQHGLMRCWLRVDLDQRLLERVVVEIAGTGTPCPPADIARHVSSFPMVSGEFVFHAFEHMEREPIR